MKSNEIAALLPSVFRRTILSGAAERPMLPNPGSALLACMELLHEPSERILENLHVYFDPRRTPEQFVYYLAAWLDLERFLLDPGDRPGRETLPLSIPLEQLREWIANAARLSRLRGTRAGLLLLLETATGVPGFSIRDESGPGSRPFHLRVAAPARAMPHRSLIERIIDIEKPAYMTSEPVEFSPSDQTSHSG